MVSRFAPFRIKVVEPIRMSTRVERERFLKQAGFNLFGIDSESVLIDLLTDSGMSAMSARQWGALMQGDESYAGGASFRRFQAAVQDITGFEHVIPAHQGRAAERILFSVMCKPGDVVPGNTHFDTTRANIEHSGASAVNLLCGEALELSTAYAFKGNMDVAALQGTLDRFGRGRIPLVMLTVTNNSAGDQPVSMANLRAVKTVLARHGIPLFLDACRFSQNAYFIQQREAGYQRATVREIAREMFSLADGCTMSAKKDGLSNIGGFIALGDGELARRMKDVLILTEGFPTYGGLAGRDLEAIAIGLEEGLDDHYLQYHADLTRWLGERLSAVGVPIIQPPGGYAVFINASALLPHLPATAFPGHALAAELYLEAGIRTSATRFPSAHVPLREIDLVRLALPSRVYSTSHLEYVVEAVARVYQNRAAIGGLQMVYAPPVLQNFTARFARITRSTTDPDLELAAAITPRSHT
ncbi:MAG: tryptophanase [Acidobacteria bacterium]|nr:tryptophanase [Acidobacteriota bacterium]